jgi:hypothetical protein
MLTRARAVVIALAALTLGACSNVHPGSAAVVDGESISMRTLDTTAAAYCAVTLDAARHQTGAKTISNAEMRRQAIVGLVSLRVARDLAQREGLQIRPSSYELTPSQRKQLAKAFPSADVDELARAIEDSQEVSAIAVALAERSTGQQVDDKNEDQLAQEGQKAILAAFKHSDVKFAPRFGLDPAGKVRADTGSISVTPVDLEDPVAEELPAALRCS